MEGGDFSKELLSGEDISSDAALIMLPVPFHEWRFGNGGREYRGIRIDSYTYAKDLKGPWLLYDKQTDSYQMNNLAGNPESKELQDRMEKLLQKKLAERKDEFLPADDFMTRWNYLYDRNDSIPASNYLEINRLP